MLRGLYTSVSSMLTLQSRQGIITNNLANINTTGYKQETLLGKSFDEVMLSNNDNYKNGKANKQILGNMSFGVRIDDTFTNYSQGTNVSTENNMDFAIEGNGFFEVMDNQNNRYYTRNGDFSVDAQGYLITSSGHYVLGVNNTTGATERINVGNNTMSVTSDNAININGQERYRFRVVDFQNYDNLQNTGNGVYTGTNPNNATNFNVKQGYLESSNVDSINSAALLMETVKEFEANQKVVQAMDSILYKIANEVGRV
ncbi:flagellar hook-basal body complex protein [Terrisporobacter glycolicus]|uniref:Flagellar basal-body rod protein FlgG n=1 Tax=Terrisporobacter petrolearius TaxID=1460447 RepID=A0ABZ3FDK8_9FIRM|nr:flagellar hook-basal body complex protein [Terrisporobacter glycolicus]